MKELIDKIVKYILFHKTLIVTLIVILSCIPSFIKLFKDEGWGVFFAYLFFCIAVPLMLVAFPEQFRRSIGNKPTKYGMLFFSFVVYWVIVFVFVMMGVIFDWKGF